MKKANKQGNSPHKRLTVLEVEQYLRRELPPGISTTQIYNHIRKAGLTLDSKRRVDLVAFMEAYMRHKADDPKTGKPAGTEGGQDPKRYKTVLECMILKIKHDQLKGELVPMDEHLAEVRELVTMFRDVYSLWIAEVRVLTGDARLVSEAERLRDKALARMQKKCKPE